MEQCQGITAITALNRRLAGIDLAKDSADFARMIRQIIPNCRQSRQYVCITTRSCQGHFGSGYITTKQSSGSVADRTANSGRGGTDTGGCTSVEYMI